MCILPPSARAISETLGARSRSLRYYHARREWPRAYQTLEDMRRRRIVLHPYLEADLIAQIHEAVGEPIPAGEAGGAKGGGGGGGGGGDDDVDEDIDEDVPDDVPDDSDGEGKFGDND